MPQRGNPVSDNQRRPVPHDLLEASLNFMLRLHINRARSIVQHENPRVRQQRSGNRDPLLLTA
ncbi:hypothetical protein D3C72_2396490 [compost metagenome]